MEAISDYIRLHAIELIGAMLSLIYLYLSIRQKNSLWIFGFLCSAFYIIVFYQSKFYADMSLQFYYLAISVFGWFSWQKGKTPQGKDFVIRRTPVLPWIIISLANGALFIIYYFILSKLTDSPLPAWDSFTTALSITATWMLARKYIEHWLLWIVVDAVSAGLYFYRELYPTAILFVIYTVMAAIGYGSWRKEIMKSENN